MKIKVINIKIFIALENVVGFNLFISFFFLSISILINLLIDK